MTVVEGGVKWRGKRGRRGKQRGLSVAEQGKWQIIHGLPKSVEAPSAPALLNTVPSVCIWHLRDVCLEIPWHCALVCLAVCSVHKCEKNLWVSGNPDANLLYSSASKKCLPNNALQFDS